MKIQRNIILVPTYNERENIGGLLNTLVSLYPEMEVWIIDDNSPDGTGGIVEAFLVSHPQVKLIKRQGKEGLGAAYKHALHMIQKLSDVDAVLTMDADGSHDPESVGALFSSLENADIAVGSRYVKSGKIDGWDKKRLLLSWGGNLYVRLLTRFPIKDSTAGFNAFRKSILDKIDLENISSLGYSYQIEFKNALLGAGARFVEVPITFRERKLGKSKVSGKIVTEGILAPIHILMRKVNFTDFKKYAVGLFLLFTLFFATYKITESPSVWYDEGLYFQVADHVSRGEVDGFVVSPGNIERVQKLSVGYPLTYPLALVLKIFGRSILVARLFMAFCIMSLVIVSYLFSKKTFVKALPLLSLAFVATFPPLYGNGKSVLGEVPGLMYLVLALLFFRRFSFVLAGVFLGLAIVTKPIFILLAPALIIAFFFAWRKGELSIKDMGIISLSALLPFIVWLTVQFQGATLPDIIGFYTNPQPGSASLNILSNLKHLFSDVGLIYLTGAMICWVTSVCFRVRKKISLDVPEIISFIFSLLIVFAYLRTVGHYRYLFPAQIISLIYFPNALFVIFDSVRKKMKLSGLFETTIIFLISLGLLFSGTYQMMFNSWTADSYSSHKTEFWIKYFEENSPKNVLFYNVPEVAIFAHDYNYFQYLALAPAAKIYLGETNKDLFKKGAFDKVFIETAYYEDMKNELSKFYTPQEKAYKYTILKKINNSQ